MKLVELLEMTNFTRRCNSLQIHVCWDQLKTAEKLFADEKCSDMTRTGKRLIQDFIIPALESHKYGELLQWVDRNQRIFQIKWSHKNAARWSHEDTNVFQDWDRLKGHYKPEKSGYFMQAKQRFRAALQKLKTYVQRLEYAEKGFKRYRLLNSENNKCVKVEKDKKKPLKKPVKAIPTSVICQNLSYNRNNASFSSSGSQSNNEPSPSSSPFYSQDSNFSTSSYQSSPPEESSPEELERLEQSYKATQEKQLKEYEMDNVCVKEESMFEEEASDSDQKENLENMMQRIPPHVAAESVSDLIPVYENFSIPRFESPKFLLVRTHYESRPRPMGNYNIDCAMVEPSALNLSVKQEVK